MKICLVTCYNQPNYVRTKTLRAGLMQIDGLDIVEAKNRKTGLFRYPEVLCKVLLMRLKQNPDVYLLTFRGYEMLLPVRLISVGKSLIYDEFINPIEWVVHEKRQVEAAQGSNKLYGRLVGIVSRFIVVVVSSQFFSGAYRLLVRSTEVVLADTQSHADISSELTRVAREKFVAIPVGTDELTFKRSTKRHRPNNVFTVFYYGNMLPLHGLQYVIQAAVAMKDEAVRFVLVGGNDKVARDVSAATSDGAHIEYEPWVEFETLPALMHQADLCLAGPFGDTFQARYVVTGKAYQYLAMGRPIVVGQNMESGVFTDRKDALVVPQGSSEALAESIRWAMSHREKLDGIGRAGRALYEKEFSGTRIATHMRELLARLGFKEFSASSDSQ